MRTLVLNAGYEPMFLSRGKRHFVWFFHKKAEVLAEYSDIVRTVTQSFALPSVVRLKRYVRL